MAAVADRCSVYTDGACLGNPGPGGWAWAVPGGAFAAGAEARTTNQRMELTAVLEAVTAHAGPLEVVSDSTYVVNCFRDRWWEGWLARGWLTKARQPVANRDLWEPLVERYRADPGRLRFRWVKGHSTDPGNDLVDRLAVEAARTQRSRTGTSPPAEVGDPDPGPASAGPGRGGGDSPRGSGGHAPSPGEPPAPAGHRLVVAGHRPPELGGYEPNPTTAAVTRELVDILTAKRQLDPDLVVLTGLALGAEQLGAEAASAAGVPYVAALAFPDPDEPWPSAARRRFAELRAGAAEVVVLQGSRPRTRQQAGAALRRRDGWLARVAHEAVVVWDGREATVGRLLRSLVDVLGEEEVWVLTPPQPAG